MVGRLAIGCEREVHWLGDDKEANDLERRWQSVVMGRWPSAWRMLGTYRWVAKMSMVGGRPHISGLAGRWCGEDVGHNGCQHEGCWA